MDLTVFNDSTAFDTAAHGKSTGRAPSTGSTGPPRPPAPPAQTATSTIDWINATLKTELSLGRHTHQGDLVQVLQRHLALAIATWHTDQPVLRSLTTDDH